MVGQTQDREDSPYDDTRVILESGMLRETLQRIDRTLQNISPKSNEQASGNIFMLGLHTASILPYDRQRVRATIQNPTATPPAVNGSNIPEGPAGSAQTGGVFIGLAGTVRAGGGFWLPPGGSLVIESVAELLARATVNPTYLSILIEREGGDIH